MDAPETLTNPPIPNPDPGEDTGGTPQEESAPSLLFHSTMDDALEVLHPDVAQTTYATLEEAIPGPAHVMFEPGANGDAARFDGNGFEYQWPIDGPLRFHGDNFDFDDESSDGGRLDFWIRFDVDPHTTTDNTWVARSNWGERYVNLEFAASNSSSPAYFMFDVYSDVANGDRTNFGTFRVSVLGSSAYEAIREGEWHRFTLTWRRNGGPHKAELHLYIDGTQDGCWGCNDYNGNLPPEGSITDFFLSPQLYDNYLLFTVDDIYSFADWTVGDAAESVALLQIPEGVTLTYPMDEHSPTWGLPVRESKVTFELVVQSEGESEIACDLYVDDDHVASVMTHSQAHTEVTAPDPLADGSHSAWVACDGGRLVSPVSAFTVSTM